LETDLNHGGLGKEVHVRVRLRRSTIDETESPRAEEPTNARLESGGLRLSQRAFLKTIAIAGLVGVGEATLASPRMAEASYNNGSPNDTATNNLLVQGNLQIGSSYSPTGLLTVTTPSGSSLIIGIANTASLSATGGGANLAGISNSPTLTGQSNTGNQITSIVGISNTPTMTANGNAATGSVFGVYSKPSVTVNGPVTNLFGLDVDPSGASLGGSGSVTNSFGIYVSQPSVGTNKWTLYSAGGNNYFAGNVGIGVLSPQVALAVGNGSLFQVNSSGAIVAATGIASSGTITFSGFTSNGGPLYANASGVLAQTAAGATTQVLHGGPTPSFGAVALTTDVTGILPIANGGTNYAGPLTAGSIMFFDGTAINQNNGQLYWDNANLRLGIATTTPAAPLAVGPGSPFQVSAAGAVTAAGLTLTGFVNGMLRINGTIVSASQVNLGSTDVTGTLPIGSGGTGQTTALTAYQALSPMTTLGDLTCYGTSSPQRLAGNTTMTKQFLTQTGNGSASALPAWGPIAASDVPSLPNLSGTLTLSKGGTNNGLTAAQGALVFSDSSKLNLTQPGQLFWDSTNLYLGIGTAAPATVLHTVSSGDAAPRGALFSHYQGDNGGSQVTLRKGRGTLASPSPISIGDVIGRLRFEGCDTLTPTYVEGAYIITNATEIWSSAAHGTYLAFGTTANTTTGAVERLRIDQNGNVGIGTTNPQAALHLNSGVFQINATKIADQSGVYYGP
jgi:hypothetical protein